MSSRCEDQISTDNQRSAPVRLNLGAPVPGWPVRTMAIIGRLSASKIGDQPIGEFIHAKTNIYLMLKGILLHIGNPPEENFLTRVKGLLNRAS